MTRPTKDEIDEGLSDLVAHCVVEIETQEPNIVVPLTISLMDKETVQRTLIAAVSLLALYIIRDRPDDVARICNDVRND